MSIPDNIRKIREQRGISQKKMSELIGEKRTTYAEWERDTVPKADVLLKIADQLKVGIGSLLGVGDEKVSRGTLSETEESEVRDPIDPYLKGRGVIKNGKKKIPFYDAEASASDITLTEMSAIDAPAGTIDVGDLLSDSQAAIRIYGNSMLPNYPPGCVVGLSKIRDSFIQPGEVYVVETREQRVLKRLFYKNDDPDEEKLTLYSDNIMKFEGGARNGKLAYPPYDVPKEEIVNLFIVTGVIKRNTNSVIINR